MPVFKGKDSSFEQATAYNIPCTILSWYLCNDSASDIDVSIGVIDGATSTTSLLYFKNMAQYSAEFSSVSFILLQGDKLFINSSSSVNYYISIE